MGKQHGKLLTTLPIWPLRILVLLYCYSTRFLLGPAQGSHKAGSPASVLSSGEAKGPGRSHKRGFQQAHGPFTSVGLGQQDRHSKGENVVLAREQEALDMVWTQR